ncbi:MAG: hypothetical protein AAF587_39275 [Bacteroidota bacterium]
MKKGLLFVTILIYQLQLFSQGGELPDNIPVPPTPEVASLGKYIETPVNEYTGIPRIGIPIYDIQQGRLSHSISLSYHAQGVKVEEIASRVGMGWTLGAGGVIHRQKRGEPDDFSTVGYLKTSNTVADFLTVTFDHNNAGVFFNSYNNHGMDYEPDLFTFNFGGYSGKFFFDQISREAILEEASPLKIEWEEFNYAYFKITTPDGVQYFFGADKNGTLGERQLDGGDDALDVYSIGKYGGSTDETNLPPEYVSTWFLKEIYDPISDESITFDYEEYDLGRVHRRLSSSTLVENTSQRIVTFEHTLSEKNENEYVLSQINFSNGYVEFVKNPTQRQDLNGAYALKDIEVYDKNDELITSYGLEHFTTQSSGSFNSSKDLYSFYSSLTDIKYRLFLSSLREYEIDKISNSRISTSYTAHSFEYSNPGRLPHRFSNAQDFWGFHNGVTSNENLLPKGYVLGTDGYKETGEADRQIDQDFAKDGVLTKVIYPTGGFSEYFYENNQAKKEASPLSYYENSLDPIYYSYDYDSHTFHEGNVDATYDPSNWGTYTYFTLDDFNSSNLGATQIIDFNYTNYNNGDPLEPYWEAFIQQYDETTSTWPGFGTRVYNFQESGGNQVSLDPGQYRIVFQWIGGTNGNWNLATHGNADWQISFDYLTETDLSQQDYVLTGGLRVHEIKTNDLAGNIYTTKYSYEDENGETTGNLVSLPFRLSSFTFYFSHSNPPAPNGNTNDVYVGGTKNSSDTSVPLATTQSSYTGYNKVTKIREGGENGKTEFNFSFERNGLDMTTLYAYPSSLTGLGYVIANVPLVNEEMKRGKLISKIDYNDIGDIVQKVENEYQLVTHNTINAISLGHLLTAPVNAVESVELQGYGVLTVSTGFTAYLINKYHLFSRSHLLTETSSTIYESGTSNSLTTVTNYFYDNYDHLQQTRLEVINSSGETLKTQTYYAQDVGNTQLESEHRIAEPLKVETYSDNVLLTTKERIYSSSHNTPGHYLPESIQTFQGTNSPTEELIYHGYNEFGRVREVSKAAGAHTVYIWGYDEQYPIAKIENSTYSEISNLLNISNLKTLSNQDDDHCLATGSCNEQALRTALNVLRTLPDAMVTTYTYDPLVGITSVTAPNGFTTYYRYDGFGRLQYVQDQDGNYVQQFTYHLKDN